MSTTTLLILIALPILIALSALLSAAETALFSLDYHDRLRLRRLSARAARSVDAILANPRELLVSVVFANFMVNTLYFVLTSMLLLESARPWVAVAISVVNLLALTVIGEVVAKMLAARLRVEFSRFLAPGVRAVIRMMGPLRVFLDSSVIAPLARLLAPVRREDAGVTTEELSALLSAGTSQGAIDSTEQNVLRQVIRLGSLRVRDVMTPRIEIEWLEDTATGEQVVELARRTRITRIPICRGSLDEEVLGLLDAKAYLARLAKGETPKLSEHLLPSHFVPERATLDRLLETLRHTGAKIAFCVDEYGSMTGLVAIRNIIRRLTAEFGSDQSSEDGCVVEMIGLGKWLVPGRLPARDWSEMFGLPSDPRISTVAGLVLARLGRIPFVGDKVRFGNLTLEVQSLEGRVADKVIVTIEEGGFAPELAKAAALANGGRP